jgi:hypothetical protein
MAIRRKLGRIAWGGTRHQSYAAPEAKGDCNRASSTNGDTPVSSRTKVYLCFIMCGQLMLAGSRAAYALAGSHAL